MSSAIPFRPRSGPLPGSDSPSLFVDDVFDAVVSLPRADRDAFLRARCEGHPSVEAEVRALLEAVDDGSEVERPLVAVGARLGRYRLDEQLGAGATASVWKAFDEQLRAWTALKLLHPHVHARHALDAVMTEARAASRIISDHVVRIKSAGRFGDLHYIDMALCAEHRPDADGDEVLQIGSTLADTPLRSVDEVLRVVAEAAHGVDAAHRVGVLHRDLKPANILLLPVSRRALVTDFGLAAPQLYPIATAETPPTQTCTVAIDDDDGDGKLVGTPCFMPPEQARGKRLLRASDVYSLGATLYILLTGSAPYQPKGIPPRSALEIVSRVCDGPPADVREVDPRIPERLARIVRKAMAREAHERYPTALALAHDLEAYRAGLPTSVDAGRPMLRMALWVNRHRSAVITGCVLTTLLCAALAGAAWMSWESQRLREAVAVADARRVEATLQADRASELQQEAVDQRRAAEEASKEALRRAEAAQAARAAALQSESDAEHRLLLEKAAREAAEAARAEAMALVEATEAARLAAEQALVAAQGTVAALEADVEVVLRERDLARRERTQTEAALRDANLELVELQLQLDAARRTVDDLSEARTLLMGELDRMRQAAMAPEPPIPEVEPTNDGTPAPK